MYDARDSPINKIGARPTANAAVLSDDENAPNCKCAKSRRLTCDFLESAESARSICECGAPCWSSNYQIQVYI